MQKYYRLNDKYILRGWEKLPYAIVNSKSFAPAFIDSTHFNALKLCSGNIDTSLPFITDNDRDIIRKYEQQGIVESCSPGQALTENQKYKKFPVRYVWLVHWSITGRCNYRCKHCCISAPDAKFGELSHEQIMSIIPQLADCGIMNLAITGGEPLVRDDFLEIVDALLERGINIVQIYTNGALVNEKLLRELDRRNIHPNFMMSYDGSGWHDWIRGVAGAEEAVNRAFALCREKGFTANAQMCIHRLNMHTLRESVKHLASLGVKNLKVGGVQDAGNWENNKQNNSLSISETFKAFLDYIPDYYADGMPMPIQMGNFFVASPDKPDEFAIPDYVQNVKQDSCVCGCSRIMMYISPDGHVLPCMMMAGTKIQDRMPLLTENSLAECINSSFWFELVNKRVKEFFALNEDCRTCKSLKNCTGGCRADAVLADPDKYMGKSPMLCEFLLGGWPEKIIELMKTIKPEAKCTNLKKD